MKIIAVLLLFPLLTLAQKPTISITQIDVGTNTSIRGMSIVSENIIWVCGSNVTVGRSIDQGKTWQWIVVPGFEKKDFRDIHA
ncbi:MAG: hypothetical protein LH478_04870, partial [Chitinophagaceae bacterium]|nr:hypothetical protein [Chitinophagaceae bacterium]